MEESFIKDINELCEVLEHTDIPSEEAKEIVEKFLHSGVSLPKEKQLILEAFIESFSL